MPRLAESERNQIIGHLNAGARISTVARTFNVSRLTVYRLQQRFQLTGVTRDRPRPGRPRVTTQRQDGFIRTVHLRNRFQPAQRTADTINASTNNRQVSLNTVLRRLREANIRPRRPVRRPRLQPRHIQNRLQWANVHVRWPRRQWQSVMFSDESRFVLERHDGRIRVYRRPHERYAHNCIREALNFGGGSIMVWGGITENFRTQLVPIRENITAQWYINNVLTPHVVPFFQTQGQGFTFMHDNAAPHRARVTTAFLNQNNINVLRPWPAMSPDLNPIEHVWDMLDRHVRNLPNPPQTLVQLENELTHAWNNLPQAAIHNLIHSMRRRCTAVIAARGGHTRY